MRLYSEHRSAFRDACSIIIYVTGRKESERKIWRFYAKRGRETERKEEIIIVKLNSGESSTFIFRLLSFSILYRIGIFNAKPYGTGNGIRMSKAIFFLNLVPPTVMSLPFNNATLYVTLLKPDRCLLVYVTTRRNCPLNTG